MPDSQNNRSLQLFKTYAPLAFMMVAVLVGHLIFEMDLRFILLLSAIIAGIFAWWSGVKTEQLFESYGGNIKKAFPVILILMCIGGIVGTWMYSGTVPLLIYYGLKFLNPDYVLVSAFVVTALVSTFTGTSWGSAATSGVAFIGIGASMGIPLPMVAGAALSGAVFGDKISPISDTTNLCSLASEVTVYQHIRSMIPNVMISGILAAIGFLILGMVYGGQDVDTKAVEVILQDLDRLYDFNLFMLLPAVLVFAGGYKGYHPVVLMILSCLLAVIVGMFSNGFAASDGAQALFNGFHISMTGQEDIVMNLQVLLNRGGFVEMLSGAVLYAILAIGFGAFMESYGALSRIMGALLKTVKSSYQLVISAFITGGALNAISGNGAFSILTTGKMFVPAFREQKLDRTILSRSMENSMTLLESLLPWHVTAVYMSGIFGVLPHEYIPFAFFNIAGIVLFLFISKKQSKREVLSDDELNGR